MARAKTVDEYLDAHSEHRAVLEKLRRVLLGTELEESIKWGAPNYGFGRKNVVGLVAFQSHVALWFHQGVFLEDPLGVLVNAQAGRTKALRQWRFTSARDVKVRDVKAYVVEAIGNQREGRELTPKRRSTIALPEELALALGQAPELKAAFEALTPGKRREYADHIGSAKRVETRRSRLEKARPMILAGQGLHDRYRGC